MNSPHNHAARTGARLTTKACLLVGALVATPVAYAVPFTGDLSVSGGISFDTAYAASKLIGTGAQSGTLKVSQAGATTASTFSDSTVTGNNPLNGTLTDLGDGFGFTGSASAAGDNSGDAYGIGIDVGLNLANNSGTNAYKITFNVVFDNQVNSGGANAYADSNFGIFDRANNQSIFFTDLFTDTVNGNENGGQPIAGGPGGPIAENGTTQFFITLIAGQSMFFDPGLHDLAWTLDGGAYTADSSSSASLNTFISVAAVENLTQPPNPVPEPASLALFGLGLAGLGAMRRCQAATRR